MADLNLDAIRKQVPAVQGWSDAQLMQYYYTVYAQPRGMSWDAFAKSVGYEPKPAESSWKQDLVNAWAHISREALTTGAASGPAGLAKLPVEGAVGLLDVAQAGIGKLLGQGAADITAELGGLFKAGERIGQGNFKDITGGPGWLQDTQSAAQAIESSPEMQGFESTITPEGAALEKGLGDVGAALAPHLPHVTDYLERKADEAGLGPAGQSLASVALPVTSALLMSDNPLMRELNEVVAQPLQAAIAKGTKAVLAKSEWGKTWLASRAAEDRLWQHAGQSQAAVEESRQIATKWAKLPLKPEDRMAVYDYQEDPSGSYPLTDAQKSAYRILYPYMDDMGWRQGYVHREALVTAGGGPGRLITSLRKGTSPALAPRLSLAEGAAEERQMFKLVPVQEVTETEAAPAAVKSPQAVESEGETGYMTDAEAERAGIARKVKDIGRSQVAAAEGAEARASAKLSEWQRQDEEMAARRAGNRTQAPQTSPEGEPPVIAYIHRDDFQPASQRTVVGIRGGNDFHVGTLEVSKDQPIVGQEITDPTGQRWRVEEATTAEIQSNSRVVYNRDLGVSVAEAWRQHRLRTATESLLNDLKTAPEFHGLIRQTTGEDLPGWEKFDNPWLQGYRAPARLRRTIDTLLGTRNLGFENVGGLINTAMMRTNFVINLWHMENMASFGLSEAAPRALSPGRVLDVKEDWGKAMDEVVNGGDDYLKLMRDGFPFMSRRTMGKEMYQHVINSLVKEVDGPYMRQLVADGRLDPQTLKYLGDGLKGMFQQAAGQVRYGFDMYESWPVWTMDDMLKMRAVYARMRRTGEDLLTAGRNVKGDFPQYRLRYSTPGIGPLLDGLQRSGIVWFLPYHVDRLAVLGRRIGKAATLDPEAAGKLLAQAALLTVVYPALDDAVRRATDTPGAHVERFGSERVISQAAKVASHQAPVGSLLSLMITPSAPVELFTHQDFKKGESNKTLQEQALDFLVGQTGQSVYMMQDWQRDKTLQENLRNAFLSQIGVEGLKPPAGHGKYHSYTYRPPRIPSQ